MKSKFIQKGTKFHVFPFGLAQVSQFWLPFRRSKTSSESALLSCPATLHRCSNPSAAFRADIPFLLYRFDRRNGLKGLVKSVSPYLWFAAICQERSGLLQASYFSFNLCKNIFYRHSPSVVERSRPGFWWVFQKRTRRSPSLVVNRPTGCLNDAV
jgi:hypothetical protein